MAIGISSIDRWLIYISVERIYLPKQNLASSFLLKLFYDSVLQKDCMHRILSFVKGYRYYMTKELQTILIPFLLYLKFTDNIWLIRKIKYWFKIETISKITSDVLFSHKVYQTRIIVVRKRMMNIIQRQIDVVKKEENIFIF